MKRGLCLFGSAGAVHVHRSAPPHATPISQISDTISLADQPLPISRRSASPADNGGHFDVSYLFAAYASDRKELSSDELTPSFGAFSPDGSRRLRAKIDTSRSNATYLDEPYCNSDYGNAACDAFSSRCSFNNSYGAPCYECSDDSCLDSGCSGAVFSTRCYPCHTFGFGSKTASFDGDYELFECSECDSSSGCTKCENGFLFESIFSVGAVQFCSPTCPPTMGTSPGQWKWNQIYKSSYYEVVDGVCKLRADVSESDLELNICEDPSDYLVPFLPTVSSDTPFPLPEMFTCIKPLWTGTFEADWRGSGKSEYVFDVLKSDVKYIKISNLPTTLPSINLKEVQVFDESGNNLALTSNGGYAEMSSTFSGYAATKCIDGRTSSMCISDSVDKDANPWLLITLQDPSDVSEIVVTNREGEDGNGDDYEDRIIGATIAVFDDTPAFDDVKVGVCSCGCPYYVKNGDICGTCGDDLQLSNQGITSIDFSGCVPSLVTSLNLSHNSLTDASAVEFLTSLTSLDLSDNSLKEADVVSKLSNLPVLDLSDNQLERAPGVFGLSKLNYFSLQGNPDIKVLPEELLNGYDIATDHTFYNIADVELPDSFGRNGTTLTCTSGETLSSDTYGTLSYSICCPSGYTGHYEPGTENRHRCEEPATIITTTTAIPDALVENPLWTGTFTRGEYQYDFPVSTPDGELVKYVKISNLQGGNPLNLVEVQVWDGTGNNLALETKGGSAELSSTDRNYVATKCIDESLSTWCGSDDSNPWLIITLKDPSVVSEIVVTNPPDRRDQFIVNATIAVFSDDLAVVKSWAPGWLETHSFEEGVSSYDFTVSTQGLVKYVTISNLQAGNQLNFKEVQVWDGTGNNNLALETKGGTAQMSSTFKAFVATKCIDGKIWSICVSDFVDEDPNPWLIITLNDASVVSKIVVLNRDVYEDRIVGATIALFDETYDPPAVEA